MKKTPKILIAFCVFAVLTACTNTTSPEDSPKDNPAEEIFITSDYPHYNNVGELFNCAKLAVRAEVLDDGSFQLLNSVTPLPDPIPEEMLEFFEDGRLSPEMFEPLYEIYTVYRVRVTEVFSGNAEVGDIIDVAQRGGEFDNTRVTCASMISFTKGDDLVLFLLRPTDNGPAGLITPWQAVYRFTSDGDSLSAAAENDANRVLENTDERNDIVLTVGDLRGSGLADS
jgi:hypothetical protein